MIPLTLFLVFILFSCILYIHLSLRLSKLYRRIESMFPGPKLLPIMGNSHLFSSPEASFYRIIELSKIYSRIFRIYIGSTAFILITNYRDFERILSSNVKLDKGSIYRFLYPWIGTGLLTSAGDKWKMRRRIITPAFHFKVLEPYVDMFNRNGLLLCKKLSEFSGKGPFDIHQIIKLYALDNICETAMKFKANALTNSESSYVRAIKDLATIVTTRSFNIFLFNDFLFSLSKHAENQRKALKVVHDRTREIVRERRQQLSQTKLNSETNEDESNNETYGKKRLVFLDVLLSSAEGYALSDEDICDEVNTFMFEGHDTVSSGISFALYALARNPTVQEKAYKEQLEIFGNSGRQPTHSDLQEMKYLDMVLKETQRMYPSVPFIGRRLHEDIELSDGYVLPKGAELTLFIYQLHRDPDVWPEPEIFNPDNFLPEAVSKRNAFAYVPFSAGARNCIGQRFAILEMKSCVSKILREFKLIPSPNPEDEITVYGELVLVSKNGVKVKVEKRNANIGLINEE